MVQTNSKLKMCVLKIKCMVYVSVFKVSKLHDFHIFVSRKPSARKDHVKT